MKVLLFFIFSIVVLLSALPAHAQRGWEKLPRIDSMQQLITACFKSADTGVVVALGYDSTLYIFTTTNAGATWNKRPFIRSLDPYPSDDVRKVVGCICQSDTEFFLLSSVQFHIEPPWKYTVHKFVGEKEYQYSISDVYHSYGIEYMKQLPNNDILLTGYSTFLLSDASDSLVQIPHPVARDTAYSYADFITTNYGLATTAPAGTFVTIDTGRTWKHVGKAQIAKVFGSETRWFVEDYSGTLAYSLDTGKTWQEITQPFKNVQSKVIGKGKTLLVGRGSQLFLSTNEGDIWGAVEGPFVNITPVQVLNDTVAFAMSDLDLYRTASLPRLAVSEAPVTKEPVTNNGISLYPQPASQQVTVAFPNSSGEKVVRVVNSIGQVVLQEVVPAGQRSLPLRVAALRNGLYFVETGGKSHPLLIRH